MSSSIEELKEAMAKVESSIAKLEEKIDALQPQITEATRMALESGVDQQRWGVREEQLRKKENHLLARLAEQEKRLAEQEKRLAEQEKRLAEQEKQKGHLLAQSAGGSQGPTLDPGLVTRLAEVVDYFLEKKASILLSNATTRNKDELLQLLSLRERGASWDKKPEDADLPDFTSHEWLAGGEDSADNREAYMKYLKCRVALPDNYSVMDVQPNRNLLSTPLANTGRTIRGTTDVVVAQSSNIQNNAVRNNVEALLELKKPENLRQTDHCPQAVVEHLAASQLNDNVGVVSFLTDLTNSWTVFWFGWSEYEPGVVLYKLQLHEAKAGPLALFILKNLNDKSMRELLPATFSDRLSFKEVLRQIQLANDNPKRQRMSPGSGNGGGSSEQGTSSPPEPAQRHPSSGPANESTGRSQPQGGQADQCSNTLTVMDKAYVLRRLAPRYNDDVADELDLLDMVDQSEQLEIIRSFAMKHIVPHMYGDYVL